MKNKRLAYVLLPLVLLVWGLIAQRIWFAAMEPDAVDEPATTLPTTRSTAAGSQRPKLLLGYDDPFHALAGVRNVEPGGMLRQEPLALAAPVHIGSAATSLNMPLAPAAVPAPLVVWPQVRYLGLIMNSGASNQVVLLAIDSQELLVKAGETSHGIRLVKAFRDSVQLGFNKQKRSFYRTNSLQ